MTIAASFTPKPAILSFAITHELLTMRLFLDSLANNNFRMNIIVKINKYYKYETYMRPSARQRE